MVKMTIAPVKNSYNYTCDLYRFILAVGIMAVHIHWTGAPPSNGLWWVYVEGFFIITGNFMAKHFDLDNPQYAGLSIDECAKLSITYTWNKIYKVLRYIVPVLLLAYLMHFLVMVVTDFSFKGVIELIENLSVESLMLTVMVDDSGRFLGTLWYFSAMVIVLPLVCYMTLRFRKAYAYIVSWLFAILYILTNGVTAHAWYIVALKRAFCMISLGISSYYLGKCIVNYCSSRVRQVALTIVELLAFCYIIFAISFKFARSNFYCVLAFYVGITIMLSACSYSNRLKGKAFKYLGELTVPMFVSQLFIGDFIRFFCLFLQKYFLIKVGNTPRIIAYYVLTLAFSAALKLFVDLYQARIKSLGSVWRKRKAV